MSVFNTNICNWQSNDMIKQNKSIFLVILLMKNMTRIRIVSISLMTCLSDVQSYFFIIFGPNYNEKQYQFLTTKQPIFKLGFNYLAKLFYITTFCEH